MAVLPPLLAGLAAGLALIVAIGSQNAFVLRSGLARRHVGPVVAVCTISDVVLIAAGVAGIGTIVTRAPVVLDVVRWGGVLFLVAYAAFSFRRAWIGGETLAAETDAAADTAADPAAGRVAAADTETDPAVGSVAAPTGRAAGSAAAAVTTALALTWLNPHVYLDTVLLLGSLANQHGSGGRWVFAAGAAVGSLLWFVGLGYGARLASPLFARPTAWRVLDALIGVTMLLIALGLASG